MKNPKILVVRREYIGDLVCTTPLISSLRLHFPDAYIACLVNSYNIQVLEGNPDVDAIFSYTKPRHRMGDRSSPFSWLQPLRGYLALLAKRFDYVVLATTDFLEKDVNLIRSIRPRHIVALAKGRNPTRYIDMVAQMSDSSEQLHIVEELGALAKRLGVTSPLPPMRVFPEAAAIALARKALVDAGISIRQKLVGIHISARAASQRWPARRFIELIRRIHARDGCNFMLFWSPGDEFNVFHPGDNRKAEEILDAVKDLPVIGYPTITLRELIAGLSLCPVVVCSDGGAMHLAAALDKRIVCFFGPVDAKRWHPWGVHHVLLQAESGLVGDISVDAAMAAYEKLLGL